MATACALVAFMGAAAFAYTRIAKDDDPAPAAVERAKPKQKPLKIKGKVAGLTPGQTTPFTVTVRNNLKHRIQLRSVRAIIGDASAACPGTLLTIKKVRTSKALRARKTRRVPMTVTMSRAATNACQNARFPVRYRARFRLRPHAA